MKKYIKKSASIYVALSADILHAGHINILKHAARLGKVIVGLLPMKRLHRIKSFHIFTTNKEKLF